MLLNYGLEQLIKMACPLCKSNDIRELQDITETTDNFKSSKYIIGYDITFYFCMDCNNIFGKKS